MKKRIAVIGGGIAGLTAGYLLHKRHDVTLFEKQNRLGGNAYTHETPDGQSPDIAVAAFGRAGYPNFYALLSELGVETVPCWNSYMSFHDLDRREGLYLTPSLKGSLAQGFKFLRPGPMGDLVRLFAGLKKARRLLDSGLLEDSTLAECLNKVPELSGNSRLIFLCALGLLSSMDCSEILGSPADFFLDKLGVHHDVISPKAAYSIRCVKHGTRRYVNALAAGFRRRIVFGTKIKAVVRSPDKAVLVMEDLSRLTFDKVVFACNADQALKLLADPTDDEKRLLGAWKFKEGRLVVHRDYSGFPSRDLIESYTFLYTDRGGELRFSVNGALWREPHVSKDCEYISSQHPNFPIRPELVDLDATLRTPVFDFKSCATIKKLPSLNNVRNSFFCGSYFGYGLHEDAVASAAAAARYFNE